MSGSSLLFESLSRVGVATTRYKSRCVRTDSTLRVPSSYFILQAHLLPEWRCVQFFHRRMAERREGTEGRGNTRFCRKEQEKVLTMEERTESRAGATQARGSRGGHFRETCYAEARIQRPRSEAGSNHLGSFNHKKFRRVLSGKAFEREKNRGKRREVEAKKRFRSGEAINNPAGFARSSPYRRSPPSLFPPLIGIGIGIGVHPCSIVADF